jgi:hypothetical protein
MALAMTEGYHQQPHPPQGILNDTALQLRRKFRKILPGIPLRG